jgi:hypothetical protein
MLKADQHLLQENEAQIQENPALNRGETVFMARQSCWVNGHGFSVCLRAVISWVSRFFAMLTFAAGFERAAFIRNRSLAMRISRRFEGMRGICLRMPQ